MATKPVKSPAKTGDLEDALRLVKVLLKNMKTQEDWTPADEKKLTKLTKIAQILAKLAPLEKAGKSLNEIEFDSNKDKKIIEKFLLRKIVS